MSRLARDLATIAIAFAAGTGIALVAGAESLGVAMSFGQIAFAAAVFAVIVRR